MTMKKNTVTYDHEEVFLDESALSYHDSLHRWFAVPTGPVCTSAKPRFLSFSGGFTLGNRLIHAILFARSRFNIKTTDADAVIANFFLIPGKREVKETLLKTGQPFIFPVRFWLILLFGYPFLAEKLEESGASGVFAASRLPYPMLKKLCQKISLPVISAASPSLNHILSKIDAGAYAVCIPGKSVTKKMINQLHESCPRVPVIASCGKSKDKMIHSLRSGVDAVIYRPCIPFGSENVSDYAEGNF